MGQQINPRTITSANSILMFRCKGVYDNWVQIQGAQEGNFWNFDSPTKAETRIGVDNILSGGYTPFKTVMQLFLEANSDSVAILDRLLARFDTDSETAPIEIQLSIPSIGNMYQGQGFITGGSGGVNGGKLLEGVSYSIDLTLKREDI